MKKDKDLWLLEFHWNRLSYWQKKHIVFMAQKHRFTMVLSVAVLYLVFIISRLVVPFPRKVITAHYL